MNNGRLVQYLVTERVICIICINMLRLQELKQEQEFGICKPGARVGVCFLGAGMEYRSLKKQTPLTSAWRSLLAYLSWVPARTVFYFSKVWLEEALSNFERPPIFKIVNKTAVGKLTTPVDLLFLQKFADHFGFSKRLKKH